MGIKLFAPTEKLLNHGYTKKRENGSATLAHHVGIGSTTWCVVSSGLGVLSDIKNV